MCGDGCDHFTIDTNAESLCCTPETNMLSVTEK